MSTINTGLQSTQSGSSLNAKQLKRRNSPTAGPNTSVALFDAGVKEFRKVKKSQAENMKSAQVKAPLPRWSSKTDVFVPDPKDTSKEYYLATLHLFSLGYRYNLQRWLGSTTELYIRGLPRESMACLASAA